jgi:hypothetical protein
MLSVKYWEIIANNLSKAGWRWGCVSTVDYDGRTIWVADAHRVDGNRFIVRPGPPGAPSRPNCDGNNDDGGDGMTVLRSTHRRVTGSTTPRRDNTRIRNGDSRRKRPVQSQFPEFREVQ